MPTPEQVRAAVTAYCEAYASNNKQGFLDAFTDDGVVLDPVGTPEHAGREARAAFWDGVHALSESLTFDVHQVHVCAEQAAMVFTINAHLAGGGGLAIDAVDIFRVDDAGKVTSVAAYWDMAAARPLGAA